MHRCSTLVICCIDFRFQEFIRSFLNKEVAGDYDLVSVAGSSKNFAMKKEQEFLIKQLEISLKLHNIDKVYLINHQDCGAYGDEDISDSNEELERHLLDLKESRMIISNLFPQLKEIKLFFIKFPEFDIKKAVVEQIG
jgi:carbonic anhydrase